MLLKHMDKMDTIKIKEKQQKEPQSLTSVNIVFTPYRSLLFIRTEEFVKFPFFRSG